MDMGKCWHRLCTAWLFCSQRLRARARLLTLCFTSGQAPLGATRISRAACFFFFSTVLDAKGPPQAEQ